MKHGTKLNHWSDDDDEYLRRKSGVLGTASIAKHLKRSPGAVQQRACRLNLSLACERSWDVVKTSHIASVREAMNDHNGCHSDAAASLGINIKRLKYILKLENSND